MHATIGPGARRSSAPSLPAHRASISCLRRPFSVEQGACVELFWPRPTWLVWMAVQVAVLLKYDPSGVPAAGDLVARSGMASSNEYAYEGFSFKAPSRPFFIVFFVAPIETEKGTPATLPASMPQAPSSNSGASQGASGGALRGGCLQAWGGLPAACSLQEFTRPMTASVTITHTQGVCLPTSISSTQWTSAAWEASRTGHPSSAPGK